MTGINASATRPRPPDSRLRVTLPGTRGSLAWLAVLLIVGAFVVFQLGRQVYASWSIGEEADRIRAEITAIQEENARYEAELDYLQSDAYVSAEARRMQNLGRRGEHVLIIPPGAAVDPPAAVEEAQATPPPLVEQWLELFFGG